MGLFDGNVDIKELMSNPLLQIGMGILAGNQGRYPFQNAMAGGMRGLDQAQEQQARLQHQQMLKQQYDQLTWQMEQMKQKAAEDKATNAGLSAAFNSGVVPASTQPTASFMDANNAAMASPDQTAVPQGYEWKSTPATLDMEKVRQALFNDPSIPGSAKLSAYTTFSKDKPLVVGGNLYDTVTNSWMTPPEDAGTAAFKSSILGGGGTGSQTTSQAPTGDFKNLSNPSVVEKARADIEKMRLVDPQQAAQVETALNNQIKPPFVPPNDPQKVNYALFSKDPTLRTWGQAANQKNSAAQIAYNQQNEISASAKFAAQNTPVLEGGDLVAAGAASATGMPLSQVVPGFGKDSVRQRDAVRKEAVSQIKNGLNLTDQEAGAEYAARQIDFASGKATNRQQTVVLNANKNAVKLLDFNIAKATEELSKLKSTDLSPIFNAIMRGEEKWTGDPAFSSAFFYLNGAGIEAARIRSGGAASIAQLHQGAADEAQKWANMNMTPASWKSVAEAMHQEGLARIKTAEDTLAETRIGGTPQPAQSAPTPAATVSVPKLPNGKINELKLQSGTTYEGLGVWNKTTRHFE